MSKGSWRRPAAVSVDEVERNWGRTFARSVDVSRPCDAQPARPLAITLDELRRIVFETSVAYERAVGLQAAEWARAAALANALESLGYACEAERIGGAA